MGSSFWGKMMTGRGILKWDEGGGGGKVKMGLLLYIVSEIFITNLDGMMVGCEFSGEVTVGGEFWGKVTAGGGFLR